MIRVLGLMLIGFAAEFCAEVWAINYTNAVTGRYARTSPEERDAKVWRVRKWGGLLFVLTQVDIAGAANGNAVYLPIAAGAALGFWLGAGHAVRAKWSRLNGGKPEEGDDE